MVTVPTLHVAKALAGLAVTTPPGRLSANSRPAADRALAELSIVNVNVLTPPMLTGLGEKALSNDGGGG